VTEKRLHTHYEDLKFFGMSEIDRHLASRLGVSRHRVYEFLVHPGGPPSRRDPLATRRLNHPLSLSLADRLLASEASLRQEARHIGSTAKGGRPKALLPSEQRELPKKYQALAQDLHLILHWAERQDEIVTLDRIGEWMCHQSRLGTLRLLLFWPTLHERLPEMCERIRKRTHGGSLGYAERAKELICRDYQISRPQLVKAISGVASRALAA
jgi:hypothetical protein